MLCGVQQGFLIQGLMFRPLHGSPGIYQGHDSCFDHPAPSTGLDISLSGRLAISCLVKIGGITGEGLSSESFSRSRLNNHFREVPSFSFSDSSYLSMTIESPTLKAFLMEE